MRLLKVEARGPWVGQILPMGLLLLVAEVGLGMFQIGKYRDIEHGSGVASRKPRNRLHLGRLYTGRGVRVWKCWGSEVGDLMLLEV